MNNNLNIKITTQTGQTKEELEKLNQQFGRLNDSVKKIGHYGTVAFFGPELIQRIAGSWRALADFADKMSLLDARLKLATSSVSEFSAAKSRLVDIAKQVQAPLAETISLFTRLSPAIKAAGGSQDHALAITQALSDALKVSGASAAESGSAMLQFAQSMSSGALRGDEFNSVAEAAPRLMQALADGLHKPTGELREMAAQGKLTADIVANALIGQMQKLRQEAAQMPNTLGGAFENLHTAFGLVLNDANQQTEATRSLAGAVDALSANLGKLIDLMWSAVKVFGVYVLAVKAIPAAIALALPTLRALTVGLTIAWNVGGITAVAQAITGIGGASTVAYAGVGALSSALKGLVLLWGAWEIGKWAYDNFLQVRLFSVAMIKTYGVAWENLKFGALETWAQISGAFDHSIAYIASKWAGMIVALARGLANIPGLKGTAKSLSEYAANSGNTGAADVDARLKKLRAERAAAIRVREQEADSVADYMIGEENAKTGKTNGLPGNLKRSPGKPSKEAQDAAREALKLAVETQKAEFDAAMEVEDYRVEQETKARIAQREAARQLAHTGFAGDSETMDMIRQQAEQISEFYSQIASGEDVTAAFEASQARLNSIRQRLDAEVGIGAKSQTAAQIELRQETGKLGDELASHLIPRLNELIATAPDDAAREKWRALYAEIGRMQATGGQIGPWAGLKAGLDDYARTTTDTFATVKDAVGGAFKGMEDALASFVKTGKLDFKSLAGSIIDDLLRIQLRASITGPLASMFGQWMAPTAAPANIAAFSSMPFNEVSAFSTAFAQGGAPGGVSAWRNQVVDRPTFFKFATGGVFGEAGPEAIMPLARGPDGNLGVRASGGGGNVTVNVINQASGAQATTRERTDAGGNRIIDVMIEQVKSAIAGDITRGAGPVSGALASTYGLNRVAGAY